MSNAYVHTCIHTSIQHMYISTFIYTLIHTQPFVCIVILHMIIIVWYSYMRLIIYNYIYIINIMHLNDTSNPNEAAFTVPFFLRTRQHVSTCPEATNESCKSCWWVFMVILAD